MKKIFIGFLMVMNLQAQVIEQDINCHQGLIDLTMVDTSNTPGIYHLYYYDNDWILLQGAYIEFQPDTFYMTFSGIGQEMHSFEFMKLEFNGEDLASFSMPCIGVGIEPEDPIESPVTIEYYNLSGQRILGPKGLYLEVKKFRTHQTVSKKYARDW